MHLLREGQFSVASSFLSEAASLPTPAQPDVPIPASAADAVQGMAQMQSGETREKFLLMYSILNEMKHNKNLVPAIEWARENRQALEARGSNLEFELCRLQFVWLFHGGHDRNSTSPAAATRAALEYARREFGAFQTRYLPEIQQLMGAMAYCPNLDASPYRHIFNNPSAWDDVAGSFAREFCFLLGLSADSPLYVAATAGAIALPTLLKLQTIMKEKRTEWTSQNELPVSTYLFTQPNARYSSNSNSASTRSKSPSRALTNSTRYSSAQFQRSKRQTKIRP